MKPPPSQRIQRHLPILVLILLNLLIGILVIRDYGESWDEAGIYGYANESIQAYVNLLENGVLPHYVNVPPNAENYGPAYAMITSLLARGMHIIDPAWSHIEGWHLGEFLAFQLSVLSLYFLARKWMGGWAALGATLLYSTQPLLWGHAFMNPKDMPFLGFFLASITAGIYMVDALPASLLPGAREGSEAGSNLPRQEQGEPPPSSLRKITIAYTVLFLDSLLFLGVGGLSRMVSDGVIIFYQADKTSLLGSWFSRLARNSSQLPVTSYVHKAQAILLRVEIPYVIAGFVIGALAWIFLWYSRKRARSGRTSSRHGPGQVFLNPWVLGAGCLLGFTTSIRVAGPYAGVIVLIYAFYKSWRKALLLIVPYTLSALLICYLTWPYLWGDAVQRLIASATLMSHYPYPGPLIFAGVMYPATQVPGYVLPALMAIQLTEVVPVLFFFGLVLSAWNFLRGYQREPFALTILWFVVPLAAIILDKSVVYDNFRQELFLVPPVFIMGGIALEALFSRIKRDFLKALVLALAILPGLYANVTLQPYQYIYYNSFVGGVTGASGRFESDYWSTSYREAAQYVNRIAPADATIAVSDPVPVFKDYARPDLNISSLSGLKPNLHYDFVVLHGDEDVCRSIPPAKTIVREGVVLAVIKAPPLTVEGCP